MVPVEPISLTIGAVALASLFSLCVECFDIIEVGKKTNEDYELTIVKLSIEKRRLMVWGEAVGILRPDQDRDPLLDDPETRELVERILSSVQRLFNEAKDLRAKYGLEKTASEPIDAKSTVEGSVVCSPSFQSSPLVQFQTRFSESRKKAGFWEKTRWAIRDSKKFTALTEDLKHLIDALHDIETSPRTTVLKSQLVREETEAISNLEMLTTIERTCSDEDWRDSASSASTILGITNMTTTVDARLERVREWFAKGNCIVSAYEAPPFTTPRRRRITPEPCPVDDSIGTPTSNEYVDPQVLMLCGNIIVNGAHLREESERIFNAIKDHQTTSVASAITTMGMMGGVVIPQRRAPHWKLPTITIYCPPRLWYIHIAMMPLNPFFRHDTLAQFRIRIDDRLLDISTMDGLFTSFTVQRMKNYQRDIKECIDQGVSERARYLQTIDMDWLEQRIEALEAKSSYLHARRRRSDRLQSDRVAALPVKPNDLDWNTILNQSKDDTHHAAIIVMAGQPKCWQMVNSKPVKAPSMAFHQGRTYRLRELNGEVPGYKWQAEHYSDVLKDPDFGKWG